MQVELDMRFLLGLWCPVLASALARGMWKRLIDLIMMCNIEYVPTTNFGPAVNQFDRVPGTSVFDVRGRSSTPI